MADSLRYKDWYSKAELDLQGAKILYKYEGDNSIVAFHCQQAIEKAFKGYILKHTNNLIDGHSLIFLCKTAANIDATIKQYLKDCAFVNQFYIETRYPADIAIELENSETEECITIAGNILNSLRTHI